MNQPDCEPENRGDFKLPAEFSSLEANLAKLTPRGDRLNRERILFLAGQKSVASATNWGWPTAFGAMTTAAAVLFVLLITRHSVVEAPSFPDDVLADRTANLQTDNLPTEGRNWTPGISARDIHRRNVDFLMIEDRLPESELDGVLAPIPKEELDHSTLTPWAWQQVLDQSDTFSPSVKGASRMIRPQGVNS